MQRFEPSIDLDFGNGFFKKACQLERFFFGAFQPSPMRPRDTVEMQGFELEAIFVATSDLQNIFKGGLASTPGTLWNGKLDAESLGNAFAVRKTDRLHFCNGLWAEVPAWIVNMQSTWPSHLAL